MYKYVGKHAGDLFVMFVLVVSLTLPTLCNLRGHLAPPWRSQGASDRAPRRPDNLGTLFEHCWAAPSGPCPISLGTSFGVPHASPSTHARQPHTVFTCFARITDCVSLRVCSFMVSLHSMSSPAGGPGRLEWGSHSGRASGRLVSAKACSGETVASEALNAKAPASSP